MIVAALCASTVLAAPPSLDGIAHVAFRVADLDAARGFYQKLGFEQAFEFNQAGQTTVAFLKINDHQFIELYRRMNNAQPLGLMHICLATPDLETVRAYLVGRELTPSPISQDRAGNLLLSLTDPDGQVLEYQQYLDGSMHASDHGKHLGERRLSQRLMRANTPVRDADAARMFYMGMLGFEDRGSAQPARLGVTGTDDEIEMVNPAAAAQPRITFAVEDAGRAALELRARGLAVKVARGEVVVTDPDGTAIAFSQAPPEWASVADALLRTPAGSYPFDWGEGVQMMGLMRFARATRDARYSSYVEKWARLWESQDLEKLLNIGTAPPNPERPGYCGHWSPASAILYLYQDTRAPAHLKLARGVAQFILTGAERSPEGGLGHWQASHQLWVDTLYMACPLLAALGEQDARPEYIDDAADQILVHARHLQDPGSKLIYHMWDWQTGTHSEGYWGRGQGWMLMSLADTLEVMKKPHRLRAGLEELARSLVGALAARQDADGMWHTVVDDPASYAECSATAMIVYAVLKLARLGVLEKDQTEMAWKAWRTINERYVKNGKVVGVSAGTSPGGAQEYRSRPLGSETWGTGAYLLAASEVMRRAAHGSK